MNCGMPNAECGIEERPILMSGPMVLATLREIDPKTQTRRAIDHLFTIGRISEFGLSDTPGYEWHFRDRRGLWNDISHDRLMRFCPYGSPGDRLWVRENHKFIDEGDGLFIEYCADSKQHHVQDNSGLLMKKDIGKCKPSIFMFRWASRILLEITDIRVERIQDISEQDAIAEGLSCLSKDDGHTYKYGIPDRDGLPGSDNYGWHWQDWSVDPRFAYRQLWDSINKKRGFGWAVNPWVWVLKFKRIKP